MDQKEFIENELTDRQQDVLKSIRVSRIIFPILIGIGVVIYLFWQQFDAEEFAKIHWTAHTLIWIIAAILIYAVRHLAYAWRLLILSNGEFGWKKSIELIFIWEFSSAVSPTSVGGSAVAFFVLAQEKVSTAKTATIVLYTIVLDTIFFISSLPILYLFFGTTMIRPDMESFAEIDAWGIYFITAYCVMAIYGGIFYYGLFVSPNQMKRLLVGATRIRFLRRYRRGAVKLGNDMIKASKEMKRQPWSFHLGGFFTTAVAWITRFVQINFLIQAFAQGMHIPFWDHFQLYSLVESMFVIISFSPTPGGAGFAEILFGDFTTAYVKGETSSFIIQTVWRVISYYVYLLAGVIVIPNWVRNLINERKQTKVSIADSPTEEEAN